MKEVHWHWAVLRKVKTFSTDVKKEIGYLIFKLQKGERLQMPFSKPVPILGRNCSELRVNLGGQSYRIFYLSKLNVVIIFHVFQKKTQKIPNNEIKTAIKRLQEIRDAKK